MKYHLTNLDELQKNKHILLLQGPIGSFFYELSQWLTQSGCSVYKINFNGGDEHFYPATVPHTYNYQQSISQFSHYLSQLVSQHQITAIVCFGDTRPYHHLAKNYCQQHQLSFWAFEEGYFRPDYITLEKDGVNDFSTLPRQADFFLQQAESLPDPLEPEKLASKFYRMAKCAVLYYAYAYFQRKNYPNYLHHREISPSYYIKTWSIAFMMRAYYRIKDYRFGKKVQHGKLNPFFILPLQVFNDSQVRFHSDYENMEQFLIEVLNSFLHFAPKQAKLIVKHHPMDRGLISYKSIINQYQKQYPELKNRLFYIHDLPMPTLLRQGVGMVTLNSTSGISALLHNMPVITLGRANYNIPSLTYQGNLDQFWRQATPPNPQVFEAYRKYHLFKTHINGSYYTRVIFE